MCCLQDNVTPPGQARQISVGLAVLLAILILLPMTPESSDSRQYPAAFHVPMNLSLSQLAAQYYQVC